MSPLCFIPVLVIYFWKVISQCCELGMEPGTAGWSLLFQMALTEVTQWHSADRGAGLWSALVWCCTRVGGRWTSWFCELEPPCGFAARQPQGRRTSYLVGSRRPEWEFQQTRWKLAWYDLASNVQWCPFRHILLVGALTNPLRFRGRDTDPLSQWERWKRTCGPVWTHVGFFCRLWS